MLTIKKQVEQIAEYDAADLGRCFAHADGDEQAKFLNAVATEFKGFADGHYAEEMQMLGIIDTLSNDAKDWLTHFVSVIKFNNPKFELRVGKWVVYQNEKGRIKSWNSKFVFVVYKCADDWDNFENYTGCATKRSDLRELEL